MARFGFVAALAAVFLSALALLQLIALTWETPKSPRVGPYSQREGRESGLTSDDDLFLLGAGKADITG